MYANGDIQEGTAGATIAAGDILYIDTANSNVLKLAQCDGTALEATACGVALNAAASGQPVKYAKHGSEVTMGAAFAAAAGVPCFLSRTAGRSMNTLPSAVGGNDYVVFIGWSTATTRLKLWLSVSGLQAA